MKNAFTDNSLQVTINPGTVYITTDPQRFSYANIAVTLKNTGTVGISVNSVAITLPATLTPANTINGVTPMASEPNIWAFGPSMVNPGEFDATSQSGNDVTINPGDTWQFTLQGVTLVSKITQPSATVTAVVVFGDGSTSSIPLLVNIDAAAQKIVFFDANPTKINPSEATTLSWNCEGIDYCIVSAIETTRGAASGSIQLSPIATTYCTLYAYAAGVILSAQWTILVANPAIVSFGDKDGKTGVDYNNNINLIWKCNQFTNSVVITSDTGVIIPPLNTGSNTPQSGTISVGPIVQKTTFTITAYGVNAQDFAESSAPININDVTATFAASGNGTIWQQDKVTLTWDIESAQSISLSPVIPNGPSLQNPSASVDIYPEQSVNYILTVTGFKGNAPTNITLPAPLVVTPVLINSFTITPPIISPDVAPNGAQLAWNTQAQVVSLDNGIGSVQPSATANLTTPADGTVYTLTAGTLQNPALLMQTITVNSLCGPYNFSVIAPKLVPDLAVEISNPAQISNMSPGAYYNVALTGVTPVSATPPASYTGMFLQYLGISGFVLTNQPFQSYTWADPNSPSGTLTVLNSFPPDYGGPYTFTTFVGGAYMGNTYYNFPITWPPFANQAYYYCVQLSGVTLNGVATPPYYYGAFAQYNSLNFFIVGMPGTETFAWADPNNPLGTVTFLGIASLNPDSDSAVNFADTGSLLNSTFAMKMLLDAENTLQVTLSPETVYISTNPNQSSYTTITLTVKNTGTEPVSINSIALTLPVTLAPADALGSITPVAGAPDLWSFGPSQLNVGEFDAASQSDDDPSLAPDDSWKFILQKVTLISTITQPAATVPLSITFSDGSVYNTSRTINIAPAVASIVKFSSDSSYINPGESAKLDWKCTGIDYCIISPIDTRHRHPSDSLEVSPPSDTGYTLYAFGEGVILSAEWSIWVENPKIVEFGGFSAQTAVNYGNNITLVWECNQFTSSIQLTNVAGVIIPPLLTGGNTVQKGSVNVGPITSPTEFTFTAYGNNPTNFDQKNPTININNVEVTLSASPDSGLWIKDKVTFSWDIVSAATVSLSPSVQDGPSLQKLSGSADYYPEQSITTLPCQLTATGYTGVNETTVTNSPPLVLEFQPVAITDFSITPTVLTPDIGPNVTTLAWNTQAQTASIDNGIGTVSINSSTVLNAPVNGTVYTLSAGTTQNPGLQTQQVTVINAFGPYTFNSFSVDEGFSVAVNFFIPDVTLMTYLKGSGQGYYSLTLTGVTATDQPGPYACFYYLLESQQEGFFSVLSWPMTVEAPPTFEWDDPNNQTGTITLTGVPPIPDSLLALIKSKSI